MLQFHAADGGNATNCRCHGCYHDLCVLCEYWETMHDWQSRVWYTASKAMGTLAGHGEEYEPF